MRELLLIYDFLFILHRNALLRPRYVCSTRYLVGVYGGKEILLVTLHTLKNYLNVVCDGDAHLLVHCDSER